MEGMKVECFALWETARSAVFPGCIFHILANVVGCLGILLQSTKTEILI